MTQANVQTIEDAFLILGTEERAEIISHGAAFRLSDLRNRLFLAQSKVEYFQAKYGKSLAEMTRDGLPDNAGYEMHEDFIFWEHWNDIAENAEREIESYEDISNN